MDLTESSDDDDTTSHEMNPLKLPIDDDLSLSQIHIPHLPSDIMFPGELNKYFQDQIALLQQKNQASQKLLENKETEIRKHQVKIKSLEGKLKQLEHFSSLIPNDKNQASPSSVAANKIVELSKKNRELTAEMESYKSKCVKLEQMVKKLSMEELPPIVVTPEEKKPENPEQIKVLNEKISSLSKKLFDQKNQNITLGNELKQANKLLAQEIGDGFTSISNLASSSSNWRGRAQQIMNLHQKLNDLQDKLSLTSEKEITSSSMALRQMEISKRQAQEQLNKDLKETKSILDETKKKLDGSRARSKVLENELSSVKSKLNSLMEKSQHDDQLIKALTNELNSMQNICKTNESYTQEHKTQMQNEIKNLKSQIEKEMEKHDIFKKIITERETKIEELKAQIIEYSKENTPSSSKSMDDNPEVILKEEKAYFKTADAERNRLMDLIGSLNYRLDSSRAKLEDVVLNLKKEKQKVHRLEGKISKLEMEKTVIRTYAKNNLKANSYNTLTEKLDTHEDLQNKLELCEEQILLLQTRVETLQEEKKMDLDNFNITIEQIRKLFQEELKQIVDRNKKIT